MATPKRGLGKGLSALIGDKPMAEKILNEAESAKHNIVENIPLNKIIAREDQPRKQFSEESLADLSQSIMVHGVIQPIIVRALKDIY